MIPVLLIGSKKAAESSVLLYSSLPSLVDPLTPNFFFCAEVQFLAVPSLSLSQCGLGIQARNVRYRIDKAIRETGSFINANCEKDI